MRARLVVLSRKIWLYPLPGFILGGMALLTFPDQPALANSILIVVTCAVTVSVEKLDYLADFKAEIETVKPKDGRPTGT